MPQSYRRYPPTKLGEEHWLQQQGLRMPQAKMAKILRYFFRFPLRGMHRSCCYDSVFLIRPTPTHSNALQVILKIPIFWFADPFVGTDINAAGSSQS